SLRHIFFFDDLEEGFRRSVVIQKNAPDRILSTLWKIIRVHVENLAAGVVAEDEEVVELWNSRIAINQAADRCRTRLKQRIQLAVFDDRICDLGILAR